MPIRCYSDSVSWFCFRTGLNTELEHESLLFKCSTIRVVTLSFSEGVYSFLFSFFCIDVMKMCNRFFHFFSRDPEGRSISNFYRFVSLCIYSGFHKVPATVLLAKNNSVMFS